MVSPKRMNVNSELGIGGRLREERKRLGMNQTEFAGVIGIHLNTQSRYEKGERDPDTAYLSAVSMAGADIAYILTGERTDDLEAARHGLRHVVAHIQEFLGISKGEVGREFDRAVVASRQAEEARWRLLDAAQNADAALDQVLRKSPVLLLDSLQLEKLLERVDLAQEALGLRLDPATKARVTVALYREERRSGTEADFKLISSMILEA